MVFKIKNKEARRLWLDAQGLASAPTGPLNVLQIIKDLGFVQLDSIRNVTRAHHHILWSRNQSYRESMLWNLLSKERALFEHFTHDASLIPMDFYPMWTGQFARMRSKITGSWYADTSMSEDEHEAIKKRIKTEGPLSTRAFDTKIIGKKAMWKRPPHKKALDYMWYCGELTTAHRENFVKFYDLTDRVVPADKLNHTHSHQAQIDWLCRAALERMSFGSVADIQKFWDAVDRRDVKAWTENNTSIIPAEMESHDGVWTQGFAPADIKDRLARASVPTSRLRIISPFDPAVRDRARLKRLFGMEFKIEIFVPAAKRRWGYYVYPLLEGDKFIGRIELKADRKKGVLSVIDLWPELQTKWTVRRQKKLNAELTRLARLIGATEIEWHCNSK